MDICSICHFEIKKSILIYHCNHKFCHDCLIRWLKLNQICPICKIKVEYVCLKDIKLSIWKIINKIEIIDISNYDELKYLMFDLPKFLEEYFRFQYFYDDLNNFINDKIDENNTIFEIIKNRQHDELMIKTLDENWCLLNNIDYILSEKDFEQINELLGYDYDIDYE